MILIGLLVADFESQRAAKRERLDPEQEQLKQDLAIEHLHSADLKSHYDQINHNSFDDRLPVDAKATRTNTIFSRDCNPKQCLGMTDWGSGRPAP